MNSTGQARRRLLVLTSTWPLPGDGGGPVFVRELCLRLATRFELRVLAPHAPGLPDHELDSGFEVVRYHYAPAALEQIAYGAGIAAQLRAAAWRWLLVPGFLLAQTLAIRRQVREFKPDAVHAHWLIPQGVAAAFAGLRIPLLCTCHGTDIYGFNGSAARTLKRRALRACRAVAVVSAGLGTALAERQPQAPMPSVLPMGVDLQQRFTPDPEVPRYPRRLLFVGRLIEFKGVDTLIRAMPAIVQRHPDVLLELAGDGPLRANLEQLANGLGLAASVRFLGRVTQAQLPTLYRLAAACIVPSVRTAQGHEEALGLVMVEALGCACPVVGSDLPGMADVLRHGQTALVFRAGDSAALAATVIRLIDETGLAEQLAARGRAEVLARFDWPRVAARYADWIEASL